MIEDNLIVPEPDSAMDTRLRMFILTVATFMNTAFVAWAVMDQLHLEYKDSSYSDIHGYIGLASTLLLLTITTFLMLKIAPERKLCYSCLTATAGVIILLSVLGPLVARR